MKALLLYPEFSALGFWNYKEVCHWLGAKYPASPLGLVSMAALLPAEWQLRLLDLNTGPLDDRDINWADLVFIGGMLPQQPRPAEGENQGPSMGKAFDQVVETVEAITQEHEADEPTCGSMIKQAIKRLNPGFNERAYGFRSFNDMLLEAQKRGLLKLEEDEKSGGYRVRAVSE